MKPTAVALLVAVSLSTMAQTAEPTTVTPACNGTLRMGIGNKPGPISMPLIVDFVTIRGFDFPDLRGVPVKITAISDVTIAFGAVTRGYDGTVRDWSISGTIDRLTGETAAYELITNAKKTILWSSCYSLNCRPMQRMF
jgi:hypothetical protein